jgi:hypothetical protein
MSPDESDEGAGDASSVRQNEPDSSRFVAVTIMTNSLQFDGLSKRHRENGVKEPAKAMAPLDRALSGIELHCIGGVIWRAVTPVRQVCCVWRAEMKMPFSS